MLFNSYIFMLLFLPVTLLGYYSLNRIKKYNLSKAFLIIMSLIFYAYFNISYFFIIFSSIVLNYLMSRIMLKNKEKIKLKKLVLALSLLFNIGMLFYFKYLDFFISNINAVFSADFALRHIVLPLGISFFTFQQLSFVIDSYKGNIPLYIFFDYAIFVTFFPQLIAGPIVLHNEIVPQFADETKKAFDFRNFSKGMYAMAYGLAKKVLIADTFGRVVDAAYADTDYFLNSTNGIFIIMAYTFQIYFDFSGYCDMSTGLGWMFNIEIPMNFNSPYRALDDYDFWKRWHITLTRFFTQYIYIPLGGNRKGKARMYLNTFIVFVVSGIWHGANWTFILWGIVHGAADIFSKALSKPISKIPKIIRWVITFGFLNVTWVIFRADNVHQFLFIMKRLLMMNFKPLDGNLVSLLYDDNMQYIDSLFGLPWLKYAFGIVLMALALFMCVKCKNTNEKLECFTPNKRSGLATVAFIGVSILSFSGISSFLYFNF